MTPPDPTADDRPGITVRGARQSDADAVARFTRDMWPDEPVQDYVPRTFARWVEADDEVHRTFVAEVEGRVAGVVRGVMLSDYEAWFGGVRVDPALRGLGVGSVLTEAGFDWARERGASVARNLVLSWNEMGLGLSRAVGFDPTTEFRWAQPTPDPDTGADIVCDGASATDVWAYWTATPASERLRGLALSTDEPWALATLTRETVETAAEEGGLLVVGHERVRGFTYRTRSFERETDDGTETWAEYGVAAWADADACAALMAAIARDAAAIGADRTRVPIPESVGAVSDVALARVVVSDEPLFVLGADLTGR